MLKITLKRSYIGLTEKQKNTLRALGLKRIGKAVVKKDDRAINGMVNKVPHLVSVEKVEE